MGEDFGLDFAENVGIMISAQACSGERRSLFLTIFGQCSFSLMRACLRPHGQVPTFRFALSLGYTPKEADAATVFVWWALEDGLKMSENVKLAIALGTMLAATAAARAGVHAFPSADSTVTASVGFVDTQEIGWFWMASLGHEVSEFLPDAEDPIGRAIFDIAVPQNETTGAATPWDVLINDVAVGGFDVPTGFTGAIHLPLDFDPIPASNGGYEVTFRVAADRAFGSGAHTLAYGGPYAHAVVLVPEPGTLALLASAAAACLRRRRRA